MNAAFQLLYNWLLSCMKWLSCWKGKRVGACSLQACKLKKSKPWSAETSASAVSGFTLKWQLSISYRKKWQSLDLHGYKRYIYASDPWFSFIVVKNPSQEGSQDVRDRSASPLGLGGTPRFSKHAISPPFQTSFAGEALVTVSEEVLDQVR